MHIYHLVDPSFNQGTLNGINYLELLEDTVDPRITGICNIVKYIIKNGLKSQHDGHSQFSYYALAVFELVISGQKWQKKT